MHTAQLAGRYPKVQVDDSVPYVDDGDVLTGAGLTAGLDLCLHLVRRDLGAHIANQLARRMVVPAHRPGGQAQFIDLSVPATDDEGLGPVLEWARANLDQPLTAQEVADEPPPCIRSIRAPMGSPTRCSKARTKRSTAPRSSSSSVRSRTMSASSTIQRWSSSV